MSYSTDQQRFAARRRSPRTPRSRSARIYEIVRIEGIKDLGIKDMRAIYKIDEATGESTCLWAEEI